MLAERTKAGMSMTAQPVPNQAKQPQPSVPVALRCDWERLSVIPHEVMTLARRQQAEMGHEPPNPDWDRLFALERSNSFLVWTARTLDKTLVGYAFCMTTQDIFTGARLCRIEALYLAPEWREGMLGVRFVRSVFDAIGKLGDFIIEWETDDR